ncbi:2-oxoglutarate dehydrogenase E1 component [Paremcibacter congregatus]|uniref:2-oxoglutarate dehydrogenase E1 component n=1 Tax=Paremcibacter congregatus TaxID=2043170 RepID=A0A2G4YNW4_9PROT|nr:2-oxoglutarate dehydrogenase E1 component [Paremcibacter congregatus]PHZ84008.1 2-oxoglutarate dehydrogenase E1 component [Paremcibacter congregatus]QDE25929.1 2-oxoglutarate dehydrogenase E1 component [Paremcibacter congregatus]
MHSNLDTESLINGSSGAFVEELFARYCKDPSSVDASWATYFDGLAEDARALLNAGVEKPGASWDRSDWPHKVKSAEDDYLAALDPGYVDTTPALKKPGAASEADIRAATLDTIRCLMMIRTYRVRGHLHANLDPLELEDRPYHTELDPATYGFGENDMDRPIFLDNVLGLETATVREVLVILKRTYCSTVGVEFMHINDPEEKAWIQSRIEGRDKEIHFTDEGKLAILQKLAEAEGFEQYLAKKYIGTKRFGLDGGESLIPALEAIIKTGGQLGIEEIIIGMPHRGRLNVLANVMSKPIRAIFHEFHGGSYKPDDVEGSGDVKYHLGASSDRSFDGNDVHLSLTPNPSHLEAVDPVALGKTRAKLTHRGDTTGHSVMTLLMHGDAAFAGQGLVAECFALSELKGYQTGGTIHVVVNNQIGFTTSPHYSRSSPYPSDMAKAVQAPVFHVNGDDPEAVVYVMKLATEYRQKFKSDVVVDMFCYRRFGHNEGDEPSFTQPLMYKRIKNHKSTRTLYTERLMREGLISEEQAQQMTKDVVNYLDVEMKAADSYKVDKADWFAGRWSGYERDSDDVRRSAGTGVHIDELQSIGRVLTTIPEGFNVHRTLQRILHAKASMFDSGHKVDWATAEALAFGSLIREGHRVRLSGQDSQRGTFSHRHSVFIDQETEDRYTPLMHVGHAEDTNATFEVIDSALSEVGVLGFEYGYTMAEPNALVLWEAQFGDFANGAQMIFDQFISSGEAKWLRMSGLVILLPHGYEGQGPEHSSARLERYLQLCAEDNMQVANCTTPANYFHILRRQMKRKFRKPLIMMTPKSLLRHKMSVSDLSDMAEDTEFHRILTDTAEAVPGASIKLNKDDGIKRVVLCSGKVYFDLLEERDKRNLKDTYLLRVEQLYPYPSDSMVQELSRFKNAETVIWCQEEPKNMGAWSFIDPLIEETLAECELTPSRAKYVGRRPAASPATGQMSLHVKQQNELVDQALTIK